MFHVLLLKKDNTKKGQINKFSAKFEMGNNKKYNVKAICNNAVYAKKVDRHLPGLYYLVIWKSYLEEENT